MFFAKQNGRHLVRQADTTMKLAEWLVVDRDAIPFSDLDHI
jgi:hypothetical protein